MVSLMRISSCSSMTFVWLPTWLKPSGSCFQMLTGQGFPSMVACNLFHILCNPSPTLIKCICMSVSTISRWISTKQSDYKILQLLSMPCSTSIAAISPFWLLPSSSSLNLFSSFLEIFCCVPFSWLPYPTFLLIFLVGDRGWWAKVWITKAL